MNDYNKADMLLNGFNTESTNDRKYIINKNMHKIMI